MNLAWARPRFAELCGLKKDPEDRDLYLDEEGESFELVDEWEPDKRWWQAQLCAETYTRQRALLWGIEMTE